MSGINLFSLAAILNFAVSKSVFRGLEPRNLWIVFSPLTKLSTWVCHIRKGNTFKKIKIAHFVDAWNSRSAGVRPGTRYWGWVFGRSDRFPSTYKWLRRFLASYLAPADRWIHIIFESNVRAFQELSVSPRVFQTLQICDTHAYVHHLITCANQKRIGWRFWKHKILSFHLLCIQTPKQ